MNNAPSTSTALTVGQRAEQMGVAVAARSGEMASTAMAAKAKAVVEARYVMAFNRPRNIDQARVDILSACKRPIFAEKAIYSKPAGSKKNQKTGAWENQFITGFSIRFAEVAIQAMKNIAVESSTIYEDEDLRTVLVSVTDLESNLNYGKEITISKTVERRKLKDGQEAISKRTNSTGETVFLVRATEDEIANKIASAESKIIRNCGLRLVPSDILEEASVQIDDTLNDPEKAGDPKAQAKKVIDAFAAINVSPAELEKYLDHPLASVSKSELKTLRGIYSAIEAEEASWADYTNAAAAAAEPQKTKEKPNVGPATAPTAPAKPASNVIDLPKDKEAPQTSEPPAPKTRAEKLSNRPNVTAAAKPVAPTPAPEPENEQSPDQPETGNGVDPAPTAQAQVETGPAPTGELEAPTEPPQLVRLHALFTETGITFDYFKVWSKKSGADKQHESDSDTWETWQDIPPNFVELLINPASARRLKNIKSMQDTHGTAAPK